MATEKQIAANRANSKRSTGPKSQTGRLKSSLNSFRHGLSLPAEVAEIEAVLGVFAKAGAGAQELLEIQQLAMAQSELARIRRVREQFIGSLDFGSYGHRELQRLIALNRYERLAWAKRKRASSQF